MFSNRVGSLFMPHNHHMAYPGDSRALMINVENRSKSATALVVRLIYLENAESENPKKSFAKNSTFFNILSFEINEIVRLSSENESTTEAWSTRGGVANFRKCIQ